MMFMLLSTPEATMFLPFMSYQQYVQVLISRSCGGGPGAKDHEHLHERQDLSIYSVPQLAVPDMHKGLSPMSFHDPVYTYYQQIFRLKKSS